MADLLGGNRKLELWRDVVSAGHFAELIVIENARATAGVKECWKHRLQTLKKELGSEGAPLLEQLLIQQAALCWLKLNLVELSYSSTMTQSITLTLGVFLGEAIDWSPDTFHEGMRDSNSGSETFAEYSKSTGQYCDGRRSAG